MKDITIDDVIAVVSKVTEVPVNEITTSNGRSNKQLTIAKQLSAHCCSSFTSSREIDIKNALGYEHKSAYEYARNTGGRRIRLEEPDVLQYYTNIKEELLPEMTNEQAEKEAKELAMLSIRCKAKEISEDHAKYTAINRDKVSNLLKEIAQTFK